MVVNEETGTSQEQSDILHPGSHALFRFWEAMRSERAAPQRSKLDLRLVRQHVPNLFILERARSGFRFRLAGSGVCELYRSELAGCDLLSGFDYFERHTILRLLNGAVERFQPCVLRMRFFPPSGHMIGVECIGLPLEARSGAIHVFGGMFAFRDITELAYDRLAAIELSGARTIWTEHLPGDALVNALGRPQRPGFKPFQLIPGGRR